MRPTIHPRFCSHTLGDDADAAGTVGPAAERFISPSFEPGPSYGIAAPS
jgi:hypothetical protein